MSILSCPEFHDEQAAYDYVESKLWPNGPVCPRCGEDKRITKMKGKSTRIGTYKCRACRKPFTVKIGTLFESSHVKMNIWLLAIYLLCSSKKGMSTNQLHRALGVTLPTAWFMSHRIREAMANKALTNFGVNGGIVEVDETYMGKTKGLGKGPHLSKKRKIVSIIDRDTNEVRSVVVDKVSVESLTPIIENHVSEDAYLMTDQAQHYKKIGAEFAGHHTVNHGKKQYGDQADQTLHTNSVENYFALFKRGMRGIYQHCAEKHLHRYLAEYDHRYNYRIKNGYDDADRAEMALLGVVGKRLTYDQLRLESPGNYIDR